MSKKKRQSVSEPETFNLEVPIQWIWVSLGAIYLLLVVWGLLSSGTWDDDCPTRYYFVRNAFNNPTMFISTYVRPLFALLYVLPLQLGKEAVIFETALIAVATCYFMYRSVHLMGYLNSYLIIPLIAFQAFYFPISFNALSEPLAALILAAGLYLYLERKYLLYAIVGGLLPLARLELAPLLFFWALILFKEKRYSFIIILPIPVLIWNFIRMLMQGDIIWLYHRIFAGQENRYGRGSFWQYFHRYIFFTGPAIFYFFLTGLMERLYKRKFDFALIQLAVGFFIYVLFSWKLSAGQAAGFMRNLYPLSPFAALIALEGFNIQFAFCTTRKRLIRQLVYISIIVVLTLLFLSRKLVIHHIVTDESQYVNIAIMLPIMALFIISAYIIPGIYKHNNLQKIAAALVIGLSLSYTLITEPPIGLIPERVVMHNVAKWYQDNNLGKVNTYVNHIWFFYSEDMDYYSDNFLRTTQENLDAAPVNSIVIWDSHYADRLFGDVKLDYFEGKPYKALGQIRSSDNRFLVVVFQKTG